MIIIYIALALLVIGCTALEILVGKKRGGCLESFRLFTVIISAVLSLLVTIIPVLVLLKPDFLGIPEELIPIAKELTMKFGVPVVALAIFLIFKLITLLVYLIVAGGLKKNKHAAACMDVSTKSKVLGIVCASVISLIFVAFLAVPTLKLGRLYKDYEENRESLLILYDLATGEKVSSTEVIDSVDALSKYILSMDYVSDEAKVEALNYAIEKVNKELKNSGNAALSSVSFSTYGSVSKHQKQISTVLDVAKSLDNAGILEDISSSSAVINEDKILEAVSSESTTRDLVEAVSKLDNGGEMFADVVNNMVVDMSKGEIKDIVNEEALKNIDANKDAIVKTMMEAECFKNLSEEQYSKMGVTEREELIETLEEIKSYGMVNAGVCDDLIAKIKKSIGK